jgi:hypothetical protein
MRLRITSLWWRSIHQILSDKSADADGSLAIVKLGPVHKNGGLGMPAAPPFRKNTRKSNADCLRLGHHGRQQFVIELKPPHSAGHDARARQRHVKSIGVHPIRICGQNITLREFLMAKFTPIIYWSYWTFFYVTGNWGALRR